MFGAADNQVLLLAPSGVTGRAAGSKTAVAHEILSAAADQHERTAE